MVINTNDMTLACRHCDISTHDVNSIDVSPDCNEHLDDGAVTVLDSKPKGKVPLLS